MKTNAELAPDVARHDDRDLEVAERVLETKAGRPLGPVTRRLVDRAADPTEAIVSAIDSSTRQIKSAVSRVSVPRPSPTVVRHRALSELREAAVQNDRRSDVVLQQKMRRLNNAIDSAGDQARAENRELRARLRVAERKAARPMGPSRLPGLGGGGYSAKSHAFATYRKATMNYLRTGAETYQGQHLRDLERKLGIHTESNPDGGFFVHPEHDTGPLEKLLLEVVPMRQIATVRNINAASFKKPVNLRGTEAHWVGEREERPETKGPEIDELDFPAMELYAEPIVSQTLLEDSAIDIEALLSEEVLDAFGLAEGVAFISGNGVKKPRGLLSYENVPNDNWAWGKIGYLTTGVDGGFAAPGDQVNQGDKLWDLIYSVKSGHRQNAKFMMNRGTIGMCRTLKDGEGRWIWADAREGNPSTLCEFEVVEAEQMPEVATDSFSIAFGDFAKTYLIVDRIGMSVLRDPYTRKPYILFYTRKRVGGGIQNFEAMKLLRFANE